MAKTRKQVLDQGQGNPTEVAISNTTNRSGPPNYRVPQGRYVCGGCYRGFESKKALSAHARVHEKQRKRKKQYPRNGNEFNEGTTSVDAEGATTATAGKDDDSSLERGGEKMSTEGCMEESSAGGILSTVPITEGSRKRKRRSNACRECGRGFKNRRALEAHTRSHKKKDEGEELRQEPRKRKRRINACGECGRRFRNQKALDVHVRTHEKDKNGSSDEEGPSDRTCKSIDRPAGRPQRTNRGTTSAGAIK